MRKKLIRAVLLVIFIFLAVFAVAVYRLNDLIAGQEQNIARFISSKIGVPVQLQGLEAHLLPHPQLRLKVLTLGRKAKDEKAKEKGVRLENLRCSLKYLPLLKGKIEISELALSKPSLRFIKKDGKYVLPGFETGKAKNVQRDAQAADANLKKGSSTTSPLPDFLQGSLDTVRIDHGSLELEDEHGALQRISQIDFQAGLHVHNQTVLLRKAKLSGDIQGRGSFQIESGDLNYAMKSKDIKINRVTLDGPGLALTLSGEMNGDKQQGLFTLTDMEANLATLMGAGKTAYAKAGNLQGSANIHLDGPGLARVELAADVFQGKADVKLRVSEDYKRMRGEAKFTALQLEQIMNVFAPVQGSKLQVSGTLDEFAGSFAAPLGKNLTQHMQAQGSLQAHDLRVQGFNFVGESLQVVQNLPGLGAALTSKLSESQRDILSRDFTHFQKLNATFQLTGADAKLDTLLGTSEAFRVTAAGRLSQLVQLDLQSTLFLSPSISSSLVGAVKEIKYLMNEQGEVVFPVQAKGDVRKKIEALPDTDKIAKTLLKSGGAEKAGEFLGKALGNKDLGKSLGNLLNF